VLPLAAFTATFVWSGGPNGIALHAGRTFAKVADSESAQFGRCQGRHRVTCVVDGDTFWYRGEKIRVADINAPEVGHPQCAREAELGQAATVRLTELLNDGRFTLAPNPFGDDRDRYGRLLRAVTRGGESLGMTLAGEGLAERWKGYRGNWC
jgi:endonuclease YncB( thermonuclease family)